MPDRLTSLEAALDLVPDGATVTVAGESTMAPMALVRGLARRGTKDLTGVGTPAGGLALDLLLGAGCVASVECSHVEVAPVGFAPHFRRKVQAGELAPRDTPAPALLARLEAAASGLPLVALRGVAGSDYVRVRTDWQTIENPFVPGDEVTVAPPLAPDVALLHGFRADRAGNVVLPGDHDARLAARASKRTIVTVEEVVDGPLTIAPGETLLSAVYVTAAVHAPMAAHPTACPGYYLEDTDRIREYATAAESAETFAGYLDRYVTGPDTLEAYLVEVGLLSSPVTEGVS